jgi:hypothetical protein
MVTGVSEPWREPKDIIWPSTPKGKIPVSLDVTNPFSCWKPFFEKCDGRVRWPCRPAKVLRESRATYSGGSEGDREACERDARRTWACAGRDGDALLRLVWARTQLILEIPEVWRAVEAVEASLFSGLLWREPPDPHPGGEVEFAIEGAEAEALIASSGLRFGAYWNEHRCSQECVRARPISKAFRQTVQS